MKNQNNTINPNQLKFTKIFVYGMIVLWFLFALVMGAQGRFQASGQKPPLALGLAVVLPILLFVLAYSRHGAIWAFCQSLDLRVVVGLHFWRIIGLDFVLRYAEGRLPAGFALPAGINDIIIGLTAIPLALAIGRGGPSVRKWFVAWNIFGLLDLFSAIGLGILHSPSSFGILAGSGPTTLLMSELPRSLVPTFLVPIFILLHLLALARRKEVTAHSGVPSLTEQHT